MNPRRNDWIKDRIAALRAQGKQSRGLAVFLGTSAPTVSGMISGRRAIRADEVLRIAAYLEMSPIKVLYLVSKPEDRRTPPAVYRPMPGHPEPVIAGIRPADIC